MGIVTGLGAPGWGGRAGPSSAVRGSGGAGGGGGGGGEGGDGADAAIRVASFGPFGESAAAVDGGALDGGAANTGRDRGWKKERIEDCWVRVIFRVVRGPCAIPPSRMPTCLGVPRRRLSAVAERNWAGWCCCCLRIRPVSPGVPGEPLLLSMAWRGRGWVLCVFYRTITDRLSLHSSYFWLHSATATWNAPNTARMAGSRLVHASFYAPSFTTPNRPNPEPLG